MSPTTLSRRGSDAPWTRRRRLSGADRAVLLLGALLALLALAFFGWKLLDRLDAERSLGPVAASTPTPPAPPAPRSRFRTGPAR